MQNNKSPYIRIITVVTVLIIFLCTACSSRANLKSLARLGMKLNGSLTITDVRNDIPALFNKYSKDEVEDAIRMINNKKEKNFGALSYYESNLDSLSKEDISQLYNILITNNYHIIPRISEIDNKYRVILIAAGIIMLLGITILSTKMLSSKKSDRRQSGKNRPDNNKKPESFDD